MLGAPLLPDLADPAGPLTRELKRSYSVAGYRAPQRHRGDEPCADVHEGHLGHGGWVEVTIKEQPHGTFSSYAQTLAVGSRIAVYGPFGRHFLWTPVILDAVGHHVWIAGGTGIAPFRFMVHAAIAAQYPGRITLIFSVKTRADIIYADEIASWRAALPNLRVIIALTRPTDADMVDWDGLLGRVGERQLKDAIGGDVLNTRFFVCGPTSMVNDIAVILQHMAVPVQNILMEKYGAIDG
jgi:ferredoxin-NADP reductase